METGPAPSGSEDAPDTGSGNRSGKSLVFISYTRDEKEEARKVIELLEQAGYEVWWDDMLTGGVSYLNTTEAALEAADCVVVLWSKTAVDSHWVRDEAQRGRERGCLVPLSLDGTMAPLGFRQVQLIDVSAWDRKRTGPVADQILQAVALQCGKPAAPTQASVASKAAYSSQSGISRRALVLGGVGAVGLAGFGAWQFFPTPTSPAGSVSMAVLPFNNLTGDEAQSWFSDGLSNELRAVLTRNPLLLVSAPTSSSMNRDTDDFAIGESLGVGHVLRGSVQLVADTVRISAELVQIGDGLVRWAESFDRDFSDVFAVQSEIAEAVALSLVAQVVGSGEARRSLNEQQGVGGTDNITAYEAYLRGHAFFDLSAGLESDRSALAQFEAAIEADASYASAHAMRATMLAALANATPEADQVAIFYDQSIAAAQRAIEIEPKLALGHLALGFALNNGRLDRKNAYPHFKTAQELLPGDADVQRSVATFYAYGDQQALATEMVDRVLELDPLNARAFRTAGYIALFARDYPRVVQRMERALELNPNLASAQFAIGNALFMQQQYDQALTAFEAEPVPLFAQVGTAITEFKRGNIAPAEAAYQAMLDQYGDACLYQQAQVQTQWGALDVALERLESALAKVDPGLLFAPNDPLLDPLRIRPELANLLVRLQL